MIKKFRVLSVLMALTITAVILVTANNATANGRGDGPVILVTSQGLYYDSIVLADLPFNGPFQQLIMGGPSGLMTLYGPGDLGYLGGRWWLDVNDNGEMDDDDNYFICPLLGPGREEP